MFVRQGISRFGSVYYCCIPVAPNVSFRTFGLQEFHVKQRPCSIPANYVPYAVQEQHGGQTVLGQWPTSARIHYRPGSVSLAVGGALLLGASAHIGPQMLQQFPCRPLHYGLQIFRHNYFLIRLQIRDLQSLNQSSSTSGTNSHVYEEIQKRY
jgi:hypothetical protein